MLKRVITALVISLPIILLSCSGSSSTSPKEVSSPEITKDLQNVANIVDNFSMIRKNDETNKLSKKSILNCDCIEIQTGVDACSGSDSEGQYIDTTYTYEMDGVTPVNPYDIDGSYKQFTKSYYVTSKFKSYSAINEVVKYSHFSDDLIIASECSMKGTATIDYLDDSLILIFSNVSANCKMLSGDKFQETIDYRFSMVNGKYNVAMTGSLTFDIETELPDTMVCATGPITLASTGETVGTFQMLYSGDVRIFDNDGNLIKKTDN